MNIKAWVAEFVGTFALVWVGILIIANAGTDLFAVAFAHGLAIAILVSATAATSGGHLNPAVTVGLLMARKVKLLDALGYIAAQLLAGVVATWLVMHTMGDEAALVVKNGTPAISAGIDSGVVAWSFEVVATFFLMFAVLGTAVDRRAPKMGGLFIGLAVTMGIMAIGPMTGGALNPARWFGPALVGGSPMEMVQIVVYILGPVAGAILATIVYQLFCMPKDQVTETV